MCFCAYSEDVEVVDVEDVELAEEWLGVCSGRYSLDKSDDFLLYAG